MAESKLIGGLVMLVLFVVACVGWYYAIYPTKKACGKEGAETFVNRTRHARLNNRVKNLERFVTAGPPPSSPSQYKMRRDADVDKIACDLVKQVVKKKKPTYAYCSAGAVGGPSGAHSYAGPDCKPAQRVCGRAKFRDLAARTYDQSGRHHHDSSEINQEDGYIDPLDDLDLGRTIMEQFKRRRIPKERYAKPPDVKSLARGYGM